MILKLQNRELMLRVENNKALKKGCEINNNLEKSGINKFNGASHNRTGDTRLFCSYFIIISGLSSF
jgi:hypothetical protein